MQDKHIDELDSEIRKRIFSKGVSSPIGDEIVASIKALFTTEQLAIWNKALELVGEDNYIDPAELEEDSDVEQEIVYQKGRNTLRAELRSAIRQQIERIGGGK